MESEQNLEKMQAGIAADHGGCELKSQRVRSLKDEGYEVEDFGTYEMVTGVDSPDFIMYLARDMVQAFLNADFKGEEIYVRRLNKVIALEKSSLHTF